MRRIVSGLLLLAAVSLVGHASNAPPKPSSKPAQKTVHAMNPDRGQRVFEQNCSRCHNAPGGFSSRISGTIAMHMRVRADLSDADYKALLRFLTR